MSFKITDISFYIPEKIFKEEPNEVVMLDFVQWSENARRFTGNTYATVTAVADLSLYSPTKENLYYNEFDYPILYHLPKTLNYTSLKKKNPKEKLYKCLNWNEKQENWYDDQCVYEEENYTHVSCSCYVFAPVVAQINVNNVEKESKPSFQDLLRLNSFDNSEILSGIKANLSAPVKKTVKTTTSGRVITATWTMLGVSTGIIFLIGAITSIQSSLIKNHINTRCKNKKMSLSPLYSLFCNHPNALCPFSYKVFLFLLSLIIHYIAASVAFFYIRL
jgi:hypothetical protein